MLCLEQRKRQTLAVRLTVDPSQTPTDYDFAHPIRVRFVETDGMNIVHHSNYLAYFEEARVAFLAHVGHPFTQWRDDGLESPVLESFVTYRRPLRFDDLLTVHLSLTDVTRATFQMTYLITVGDDEIVAASGATVHGCIKAETGRPTRLPQWLADMAD